MFTRTVIIITADTHEYIDNIPSTFACFDFHITELVPEIMMLQIVSYYICGNCCLNMLNKLYTQFLAKNYNVLMLQYLLLGFPRLENVCAFLEIETVR